MKDQPTAESHLSPRAMRSGETWSGDDPGGHHREGGLRFASAGPATRTAILPIAESPEPVEATWDIDG